MLDEIGCRKSGHNITNEPWLIIKLDPRKCKELFCEDDWMGDKMWYGAPRFLN